MKVAETDNEDYCEFCGEPLKDDEFSVVMGEVVCHKCEPPSPSEATH